MSGIKVLVEFKFQHDSGSELDALTLKEVALQELIRRLTLLGGDTLVLLNQAVDFSGRPVPGSGERSVYKRTHKVRGTEAAITLRRR